MQSIANGLNAVIGLGGGKPPTASPGVVLAGEAGAGGQFAKPAVTEYLPGMPILSSGNDQQSGDSTNSAPGRVQSRINITNDGMGHIGDRHLDPNVNASQFTIGESDVRKLLQDPNTVSTPITRELPSVDGIRYVREVNVGRLIGTDKFNNNRPTSVMTVLTDKFGNLVSAFPGELK